MKLAQAKTETEVAHRMEEWNEADIELARLDPSYPELPDPWTMAAVRGILVGKIKEHIDLKMAEGDTRVSEMIKIMEQLL